MRGDTDFALTTAFDRWTTAGGRFVFGYDATATMVRWGQSAPPDLYEALVRRTERTLATAPRQRPANVKDRIVTDRGFKKITTVSEALVDFDYQPTTVHAALPGRGAQEKSVRRTGGAGCSSTTSGTFSTSRTTAPSRATKSGTRPGSAATKRT